MSQAPDRSADLAAWAARVLDERSRELAVPAAAFDEPGSDTIELVRFLLRGVGHAVEARFVRAIVPAGPLTPVPGGPTLLLGVMNLRGAIVPVFDLAALLGVPGDPEPGARSLTVVLGEAAPDLAVQVDEALDVVTLPARSVTAAPTPASTDARAVVLGLAPDRFIVLDGAALLAEPRFTTASTRRES